MVDNDLDTEDWLPGDSNDTLLEDISDLLNVRCLVQRVVYQKYWVMQIIIAETFDDLRTFYASLLQGKLKPETALQPIQELEEDSKEED